MRKTLPEDKVVVFHDGFQLLEWKDFMREEEFVNVVLDTHQYLMAADNPECSNKLEDYIEYIENNFVKGVGEMQKYFPVIIGEWCIFNSTEGLKGMSRDDQKQIYQQIAHAKLQAWENGAGWFYWSYKLLLDTVNVAGSEGLDSFDMGKCFDQDWLPNQF
ncbi:hypothetical protein [Paenibacillus sp. E222]|uniref:hypothetical protein n=1 Tax=Paenibacillus sp. E222 TaxID=2748863 RepID=UPI001C53186E|nr:hypothetical protein [Paenibacillus sp. E222]